MIARTASGATGPAQAHDPSGADDQAAAPYGDRLRSVLGRFATGVTVVTAATPDGPVGMTANAFTAVSLNPSLVLVCVNRDSRSGHAIHESGAFAVNFLCRQQRPICESFADRRVPDRFADLCTVTATTGAPVISGSLGYVDCRMHEVLPGGDHIILIGRVVDAAYNESAGEPLIFFAGGYR